MVPVFSSQIYKPQIIQHIGSQILFAVISPKKVEQIVCILRKEASEREQVLMGTFQFDIGHLFEMG